MFVAETARHPVDQRRIVGAQTAAPKGPSPMKKYSELQKAYESEEENEIQQVKSLVRSPGKQRRDRHRINAAGADEHSHTRDGNYRNLLQLQTKISIY